MMIKCRYPEKIHLNYVKLLVKMFKLAAYCVILLVDL